MSKVTPEAYKAALETALQAELTARMEGIKDEVTRVLNANVQEITAKLLGFDNRWFYKWELDHCNGRAGNSAAGDYLRKHANDAITEWLSSVQLPPMSPALKGALKKGYVDQLRYRAEGELRELASKNAKALAAEIAATVSGVPVEEE